MLELVHLVKQLNAMEVGADGVLLNTAVAQAKDPAQDGLKLCVWVLKLDV
jgi:thiazole synthase ThiGH ThiG subunit